jgi:integrase
MASYADAIDVSWGMELRGLALKRLLEYPLGYAKQGLGYAMRVKLTDRFVATAKVATRTDYFDETATGLALRVSETGAKNWSYHYTLDGKRVRLTLGAYPVVSLAAARAKAVAARTDLAEGRKPQSTSAGTLHAICEDYLAREGSKLRSVGQRRATLERLIYPRLGSRPIADIRRSEIVALLDEIEDQRGPVMARVTLQVIRKIMNYHASRDDDFRSPIVRGMAPPSKARQRVLSDDELRRVWAASSNGVFGRLVRFLLLTATRRNEAAHMNRSELAGSDWIIPAARYKTNLPHLVPLSREALALLPAEGEWMFTANGRVPVNNFSAPKQVFDQASGVSGWVVHDLRRTARTLMSRAGVSADHAERCLGHVLPGIRGTYDLHEYATEKRQAFEALAAQVDRIVNPRENVVQLRGAAE